MFFPLWSPLPLTWHYTTSLRCGGQSGQHESNIRSVLKCMYGISLLVSTEHLWLGSNSVTIRFQQLPAWLLGMNAGFNLNYTSGLLFSHPYSKSLIQGGWGLGKPDLSGSVPCHENKFYHECPRHSWQPCSSYSSYCTLAPSQMKLLNYFLIPECSQIHLASTISFNCNLIFISENPRWGMVTHPSIWKAEAVEPPQVWGQLGLQSNFQDNQGYNSEIMSQTKPTS